MKCNWTRATIPFTKGLSSFKCGLEKVNYGLTIKYVTDEATYLNYYIHENIPEILVPKW